MFGFIVLIIGMEVRVGAKQASEQPRKKGVGICRLKNQHGHLSGLIAATFFSNE